MKRLCAPNSDRLSIDRDFYDWMDGGDIICITKMRKEAKGKWCVCSYGERSPQTGSRQSDGNLDVDFRLIDTNRFYANSDRVPVLTHVKKVPYARHIGWALGTHTCAASLIKNDYKIIMLSANVKTKGKIQMKSNYHNSAPLLSRHLLLCCWQWNKWQTKIFLLRALNTNHNSGVPEKRKT